MIAMDDKATPRGGEQSGDDQFGRIVRDLATRVPPKGLDTVTAASEAAERVDSMGAEEAREHRIRTRAYELWERDGKGQPNDYWLQAETEIDREDAGS